MCVFANIFENRIPTKRALWVPDPSPACLPDPRPLDPKHQPAAVAAQPHVPTRPGDRSEGPPKHRQSFACRSRSFIVKHPQGISSTGADSEFVRPRWSLVGSRFSPTTTEQNSQHNITQLNNSRQLNNDNSHTKTLPNR